jgi:solute carrier family 25 uncoupling protein 27
MPEEAAYLNKLLLSAVAAGTAETVTYPLDFLKTRMQLAGQQAAGQQAAGSSPRGLAATAAAVVRSEGFAGLYAGLPPAVLRHVPYTGIRVMVYENLRSLAQRQLGGQPGALLPLPVSLGLGLCSGGVAQLVAVPADLVKVRMQADGRLVAAGLQPAPRWGGGVVEVRSGGALRCCWQAGLTHPRPPCRRYRGVLHAFVAIAQQQGVAGLWRGSLPAVQRAALVNLGELATYDSAKRAVLRSGVTGGDNVWAHALSSACSGFCASGERASGGWLGLCGPASRHAPHAPSTRGSHSVSPRVPPPSAVVSTPADVVKTRLMNQDPGRPTYRGMAHCFAATLRGEGLRGLYAGFLPTWARLGPWQLCFWTSCEALRKASGMAGF